MLKTPTEEDLIVGALVLEAGFRAGLRPTPREKRRVTPGSLIIVKQLERYGLTEIYEQAGFQVGAPGCSYCVGINDVDVAGEGEVGYLLKIVTFEIGWEKVVLEISPAQPSWQHRVSTWTSLIPHLY